MIGGLAALFLLSTVSLIQTTEVPPQMSLTVLELGDSFSLTCAFSDNERFYWYKLKFGYMVQTIAAGTFNTIILKGQFDNSRFTVTKVNSLHVLNIRNVSKEDEATYLCQAGSVYLMDFVNGTLLAVNDDKNQQKSFYVKQSPETESVQPGDSVTLQCSLLSKNKDNADQCPGQHSVYWFRSGSGKAHPGIIYTHSDEEEKRCDYTLSKTIQSSSDKGIYYCAVVTCGDNLFGEGTKVEIRQKVCTSLIVLGTLLACCAIVIVALVISRKQKPVCEHCKGESSKYAQYVRSADDQLNNVDGEEAELNYVALEFPSRNAKPWKIHREFPQDCLYSGISEGM